MEIERVRALLANENLLEPGSSRGRAPSGDPSFGQVLSQALNQVEQEQVVANQAVRALAAGEVTDIAAVMIASERANLSLGLTVQVRNKLLESYQDLMRMPL